MNSYLLILIAVLLAAGGQIFLKKGAVADTSILALLQNRFIWIGLFCYFFSAACWIISLTRLKLSLVYPFTFLTYVLVMAGAYFLLGEKVKMINLVVGSVLIVSGIIILNLSK